MSMHTRLFRSATLALVLVLATPLAGPQSAPPEEPAQAQVFASGPQRVALLELYTSEGCSSCPPADRWLSRLASEPDLWRRVVPIAFHVDYWNDIGWRDRFSDRRFSERQRRYARAGSARAVYTPGFFRDGKEWRRWRDSSLPLPDPEPAGELTVTVEARDVRVRFACSERSETALTAHVALLGMHLETQVRAGENRGRTLRHDFVALDVTSGPLTASGDGCDARLSLPEVPVAAPRRALAAWVTQGDRQAPLQATGGLLAAVRKHPERQPAEPHGVSHANAALEGAEP